MHRRVVMVLFKVFYEEIQNLLLRRNELQIKQFTKPSIYPNFYGRLKKIYKDFERIIFIKDSVCVNIIYVKDRVLK